MRYIIYCAGEQGRVTLDILRSQGIDKNVKFIDDDSTCHGNSIDGIPVIGGSTILSEYSPEITECIVAYGEQQQVRLKIAQNVSDLGFNFFNAIHQTSTVSDGVNIGDGIILNAQSYIGPGVRIEDHVLIDSCVNISHDCVLSIGSTMAPSATLSGGVTVNRDAFIGPNATVLKDKRIGEKSVVGAGAVVTEDVPPETTVVGVPASPVADD